MNAGHHKFGKPAISEMPGKGWNQPNIDEMMDRMPQATFRKISLWTKPTGGPICVSAGRGEYLLQQTVQHPIKSVASTPRLCVSGGRLLAGSLRIWKPFVGLRPRGRFCGWIGDIPSFMPRVLWHCIYEKGCLGGGCVVWTGFRQLWTVTL